MSGTVAAGLEGGTPVVALGSGNREAEKYGRMWEKPEYRKVSPGEELAPLFLQHARPKRGATAIDFGCGTGRGGLALAVFGGLNVTLIDFVRNSLDDDIKDMLTTQAHALRFEKVDLERGPLPIAEYGYCCDVMEHIPPDRVDRVLNNILCSAKNVFFSIATVPDSCGELIGEDLHLTVQPYVWWLQKFGERDCSILYSENRRDMAVFYVSGWTSARKIMDECTINVGTEVIEANVRHNIAQGWEQVRPYMGVSDADVLILGGGPTLAQYEDEIKERRAAGAKLVTLNGSYHWCLERGLTPSAQLVVDAREFNARFTRPVVDNCRYLIASQVHPSVFEGLPKDRTFIWHTAAEYIYEILAAQYEAWWSTAGGSTALLRAIPLLRILGYRKFHLYGCDSCLMLDEHHAYSQPENDGPLVVPVIATPEGVMQQTEDSPGGRIFYCTSWMLSQANEFLEMVRLHGDDFELEIHGDGLLRHLMEVGAAAVDA